MSAVTDSTQWVMRLPNHLKIQKEMLGFAGCFARVKETSEVHKPDLNS